MTIPLHPLADLAAAIRGMRLVGVPLIAEDISCIAAFNDALERAAKLVEDAIPAMPQVKEITATEVKVRSLYALWCDFHSNRLPGWPELSGTQKQKWFRKALGIENTHKFSKGD